MPYPAQDVVAVWHADTARAFAAPGRIERALAWLQPAEIERYGRYRFDADRHMFLLGRVMARALVGRALGVSPTTWRWREGPHGRPEIDEPTTLSFNLAHSSGVVVCALAGQGDVGVDVEDRLRRPVEPQLVRRYCAPEEVADIERQGTDGWHDRFLKYWTLKEAYLKARGLGLAVHLADVCFMLAPDGVRVEFHASLAGTSTAWAFALDALGDRHFLAVAASAGNGRQPTFAIEALPEGLLP